MKCKRNWADSIRLDSGAITRTVHEKEEQDKPTSLSKACPMWYLQAQDISEYLDLEQRMVARIGNGETKAFSIKLKNWNPWILF